MKGAALDLAGNRPFFVPCFTRLIERQAYFFPFERNIERKCEEKRKLKVEERGRSKKNERGSESPAGDESRIRPSEMCSKLYMFLKCLRSRSHMFVLLKTSVVLSSWSFADLDVRVASHLW